MIPKRRLLILVAVTGLMVPLGPAARMENLIGSAAAAGRDGSDSTTGRDRQPVYTIQITGWKRVAAVYRVDVQTADFIAQEWILYTTAAPEVDRQREVKTTLEPAGQPMQESSDERRPLLVARFPAQSDTPFQTVPVMIKYEATLFERRLVAARPGQRVKPLPPLEERTRELYLATTPTLDFDGDAFQRWLEVNQLQRGRNEGVIPFGCRVFVWMLKRYTYAAASKAQPVSVLCRSSTGDCDTFSLIFTATLRANGIPTRVLYGMPASSKRPNAGGRMPGHAAAEFFADGVGWVPVDVAVAFGARKHDPMSCFGEDRGNLLVQHVNCDLILPMPHGSRRVYSFAPVVALARGQGTPDLKVKPLAWDVRILSGSSGWDRKAPSPARRERSGSAWSSEQPNRTR